MIDLIVGLCGTIILLGNYIPVVPDYLSNAKISFSKNQKYLQKKSSFS